MPAAEPGPLCLCLCTYRRQQLLRSLLFYLKSGPWYPPDTRLIVADNEASAATRAMVAEIFPDDHALQVHYLPVPARGLAEVRNAALRQALAFDARAVAFIDDDDMPTREWLVELVAAQHSHQAPLVFGAIHQQGHPGPHVCRGTCNVLITRQALDRIGDPWFDARLNFIGGEDALFFERVEDACGPGVGTTWSIVLKNLQPERNTLRGSIVEAFQHGFRHCYIARLNGRFRGRTARQWAWSEVSACVRILIWLPLYLFTDKRRYKILRRFGGTLGAFYALAGGRYQYYLNDSSASHGQTLQDA